jgi:hypothetical protein
MQSSNNNIKMNTEKKISIADKAIQKKYNDFISTAGKNKIMWWVFSRDGIGGYMGYNELMEQLIEEKFDDKELGEIYVLSKSFNDKYETKSLFIKAVKRYIMMFEVHDLSPEDVDQAEWDAIADGVCVTCKKGGIKRKDMGKKSNGDTKDKCNRCIDIYETERRRLGDIQRAEEEAELIIRRAEYALVHAEQARIKAEEKAEQDRLLQLGKETDEYLKANEPQLK